MQGIGRQRRPCIRPVPCLSALSVVGCAAVLLAAGCSTSEAGAGPSPRSSSPEAPSASVADSCAVTQPTRGDVPTPVSKQKPGKVFGHGGLWVSAWWADPVSLQQVRSKDLAADGYPFAEKYPTWTVRDGEITAASGAPRLTVKRLDGPGSGQGSVGGFATAVEDGAHWWPTGVAFSDSGCWRVTTSTDAGSITYIVKI
jgi:hypothetical protein